MFRKATGVMLMVTAILGVAAQASRGQTVHRNVLFVGNSYTQQTRSQLTSFVGADPTATITSDDVTTGGWTLEQHYLNRMTTEPYESESLYAKLRHTAWDYVVLQGASTEPTSYGSVSVFLQAAANLAAFIQAECPSATVALYETWARRADWSTYSGAYTPATMQAELRTNYGAAAVAAGGLYVPVGDAWEAAYAVRPYAAPNWFSLHESDQSHPAATGEYLSGAVLYETLYDRSSVGSSYRGALSQADADFLTGVAHATVPEPLSLTLTAAAGTALLWRRRRSG